MNGADTAGATLALQQILFLLILTPGQDRFGDFLRVGIPLTLLIAATSAWLAQWMWLGGPLFPSGRALP